MEQQSPDQVQHHHNIANNRGIYEGVVIDLSTVPRLRLQLNPRQFFFRDMPLLNLPAVDLRQLGVELREITPARANTQTEDNLWHYVCVKLKSNNLKTMTKVDLITIYPTNI